MGQGEQSARADSLVSQGLSDTVEGICLSIDYSTRLISADVGGAVQIMAWSGPAPWVGDRVRVVYAGRKPFAIAVYGSPLGTVQSVASGIATVTGDDGATYNYPYQNGLTVAAGQRFVLQHANKVLGNRLSAEPPGSSFVRPPAPPASGTRTQTFRPTDSGNYRSGTYQDQYVEISSTRSAFYWFGRQIANTIPDSATILAANIKLVELWDNVPGTPSQMANHTDPSSRHGTSPPTLGVTDINVSGGGTIDITSLAGFLRDGVGFGVGFRVNTGWRRFDTYARSGSITIKWRT